MSDVGQFETKNRSGGNRFTFERGSSSSAWGRQLGVQQADIALYRLCAVADVRRGCVTPEN